MNAAPQLIWDFDGTLAHRRGETGWSILDGVKRFLHEAVAA